MSYPQNVKSGFDWKRKDGDDGRGQAVWRQRESQNVHTVTLLNQFVISLSAPAACDTCHTCQVKYL